MTITVGTNTWITVSNADAYLALSARAVAWASAEQETKERALVSAWRKLSRMNWNSETVALIALDTPPQALIDAQCELAYDYSQSPDTETQTNTGSNVKKVQGGPASVEYFRPTSGGRFNVTVMDLISGYLTTAASFGEAVGGDPESPGDSYFHSDRYDISRL